MKKFLFLLAVFMAAVCAKAQVAILSKGGELSMFYGSQAFVDAYEMAGDGDVITLSAGLFQAVNIQKAITVRGTGIALEGDKTVSPTYINGEMQVELPESSDRQLSFEGLTFMERVELLCVKDVIFQRCQFLTSVYDRGDPDDAVRNKNFQYTFMHCILADDGTLDIRYGNISLINSVVLSLKTEGNSYQSFNIMNCIVKGAYNNLCKCNFNNSIILCEENFGIDNDCIGTNCIVAGKDVGFKFGTNITYVDSSEGLFKEGTFYELAGQTAEILGTDGKQLGIYGGNFPFEAASSGPKVKKFDVSSKTTADGKLSVDIEIAE